MGWLPRKVASSSGHLCVPVWGCAVGGVGVAFRSERNSLSTQVLSPVLGAHALIWVHVNTVSLSIPSVIYI